MMTKPSYDELLPSDLKTLHAATDRQLAEWYHELNGYRWPEELSPRGPSPAGMTHEDWKANQPDRLDDIVEWIKNKVGIKYLLMIWQTEKMLAFVAPVEHKSDADFEVWWNAPYRGDPSRTNGEERLRSEAWWAKTREEWRSGRKMVPRLENKDGNRES